MALSMAVYCVCTLIFIIFSDSDVQDFNEVEEDPKASTIRRNRYSTETI